MHIPAEEIPGNGQFVGFILLLAHQIPGGEGGGEEKVLLLKSWVDVKTSCFEK
jgi:hypothetical protein